MPLPPSAEAKQRCRLRIREIKLEPNSSEHDIEMQIQLDNKTVYELKPIKKGSRLHWDDLWTPCDVNEATKITIKATEVHRFHRNRVVNVTFNLSDADGKETLMLESDDELWKFQLLFVGAKTAEQAYLDALDKVRGTPVRQGLVAKSGRVGDAFVTLLALGTVMAELDPTGGAKVAFSVCTMAWQRLEAQEKQNAALDALIDGLARLRRPVESVREIAGAELKETIGEILNLIEDASVSVLTSRSQTMLGSFISAYSSAAQDDAARFVARFEELKDDFDRRVGAQQLRATELDNNRAKLKELKPAELAEFDPTKQCLPGTRTNIIDHLEAWAHSEDQPSLAWMYGMAGLGKSSIAASISKRLDDKRMLATSFFCKRDSPDLRDPRKLLVTIACGLAQKWPAYAQMAVEIVRKDISISSKHIQPLYDTLLAVPLRDLAVKERPPVTFVIVVDALDECGDVTTRNQLLTCLCDIPQLAPWLKVLLTSRPDEDISAHFEDPATPVFARVDVFQYDASLDIQVFVRASLSKATAFHDRTESVVSDISRLAAGSFIWARTACTYILSGIDKTKRMKLLTSGTHLTSIDELYTTILKANSIRADRENMEDMLACLGVIISTSMRSPLPIPSLASLLDGDPSQMALEDTVKRLGSVLYADEKLGGAIRVSHPSFMDYITTVARSKDLCVDLERQNRIISKCCLCTMQRELKFNICGLNTSATSDKDVLELKSQVNSTISAHLRYSCVYWSSHLYEGMADEIEAHLRVFLLGRELLYWLETLSLVGMLSVAPSSLLQLFKCCTTEKTKEYGMVANDAYRFVLSFYDAISQSPPHLYITALALSPSNSGISKRMRLWFPNALRVVEGGDDEWSPCVRAITAPAGVNSVSLSPNSKTIFAGLDNGTIQTWDAATGDPVLAPFQGHSGPVTYVAVSPDGRHVVSGSADTTLRVWDAETGSAVLGPLRGHTDWVRTVAYSSDGCKVASGSDDRTVRIWDAVTGEQLGDPLSGHSNWIRSVGFSPDSHRVLSGSGGWTIRLWDVQSGRPILEPFKGHNGFVRSAVFSPDGLTIASGSDDQTVRIWSSETGVQLIDPLRGHSGYVMSVVFSSDGHQIVSGSTDGTVRVWDAHSGALMLGPLTGHSASIKSVVISADGRRIVSGSSDKTIRIWDTALAPSAIVADAPSASSSGHSGLIRSVAFSPDCRSVVSGSDDKTVRIWDVDTGRMVLGPLEGHSGLVCSVAYSSNGSYIASGSADKTVRIWDANTGSLTVPPLQGHSSDVNAVAFSPNGNLIASGSDDQTVRIWSASTGDAVITLTGHSGSALYVAFSPDSMRIVSGSNDRTIRVWDVETGGTVVGPMEGHSSSVLSVAFSPDGHHIASGSADKTIRIWDAQTGQQVLEPLEGHSDSATCVTYSHDGQRIISCSFDQTIRIWDAKTGQPVLEPLQGHSGLVMSVAVSSDGRYIVSGSADKTIRLWDASPYLNSSPHPVRRLPGTHIQTLHTEDDRLLVTSAQLARHLDDDRPGWVTTADGKPLLWLPPELRVKDGSLMCISPDGIRRRAVMDFSRFVHGDDWTKVMAG
ncbi:hypothetical protein RhiJN_24494 [Ceratobasidium sp. AG-Ba]|nr:hypothetical protein RhiJN_24494 [Ceratobasidium sp. AG-Ba]